MSASTPVGHCFLLDLMNRTRYLSANTRHVCDLWFSPVAQLVEQVTVNHRVTGSSPVWGATQIVIEQCLPNALQTVIIDAQLTS